jgi:hypothetical protein
MTEANATISAAARLPISAIGYFLLVAVSFAFGLHALFITGPAMRAAAHDQLERTIADEDRGFCETLGARSGSDAFATCSKALASIRQKQLDRDSAAALGIL